MKQWIIHKINDETYLVNCIKNGIITKLIVTENNFKINFNQSIEPGLCLAILEKIEQEPDELIKNILTNY